MNFNNSYEYFHHKLRRWKAKLKKKKRKKENVMLHVTPVILHHKLHLCVCLALVKVDEVKKKKSYSKILEENVNKIKCNLR